MKKLLPLILLFLALCACHRQKGGADRLGAGAEWLGAGADWLGGVADWLGFGSDRHEVGAAEHDTYALLERTAALNASGQKAEALALADSTLALAPPDTIRCYLLSERAVALTDMGRMQEAVATGHEALALAEEIGDDDALLNMCGALGIAYRRLGQTDSALAAYERGIERAVATGNREYEVYLDNCVTVLFSETNRFAEALDYARRAERAATETADTIERLSARANIGGVYMRKGDHRAALRAVLPVWEEVCAAGYNVLTLKHLSVILKSLAALDDRAGFDRYMRQAEAILPEVDSRSNGVLGILEVQAEMLSRAGQHAEALALLDTLARRNATNRAMPEERLLHERAACLSALGRKDEAYAALRRAYQLLDSVKQSDIERSLSEFSVKYKTLEKERQLAQNERARLSLENRVLWLAAALALLVAVILFLLYRRHRAAQRAERVAHRSYIRGLENERERLAKELHDGVCNDILATTLLLAADKARAERQLRDVWRDVRHLSHALMPPRFEDASLDEAVKSYVATLTADAECNVSLHVCKEYNYRALLPQTAYEAYRIVQEATANALRHGASSRIGISLAPEGDTLVVTVANEMKDGAAPTADGIGQQTMRQRADSIRARLTTTTDGATHTVRLILPKP